MNAAGEVDTAAALLTMDSVLTELKAGKILVKLQKDFLMIPEQKKKVVI